MTAQDIVGTIMTQHWDMKACDCWVCKAGREIGLHPNEQYAYWLGAPKYPQVTVPWS